MCVTEEPEQGLNIANSKTLVEVEYGQLLSFEEKLVSNIQVAEEILAAAKDRHAIFSLMLSCIEEQNNLNSYVEWELKSGN